MAESSADKVWIPDTEEAWKIGEVVDMSEDGKTLTVEVEDKVLGTFLTKKVKRDDILSFDVDHEKDFDNAFDMGDLNEAALISLLKRRSLEDKIYTFTGNILLSVNPYKKIPGLFEPMPAPGSLNSKSKDAKPHLYVLADRVANDLFENGIRGTSQSVLINGESGAGKTVAAKQIMAFLADLSQHKRKESEKKKGRGGFGGRKMPYGGGFASSPRASRGVIGRARQSKAMTRINSKTKPRAATGGTDNGEDAARKVSEIEDTILRTNPLLEAFGNARTIRNDNSSRFGKFVQLNYSQQQVIIGAKTRHFLLEKSRIVSHGLGERNYHIFYMFCTAFQEDPKKKVFKDAGNVLAVEEYTYLCPTRTAPVEIEEDPRRGRKKKNMREGVTAMAKRAAENLTKNADAIKSNDLKDFAEVTEAFNNINIPPQEQANVYRVLAAILALGNLKFEDVKSPEDDEPFCDIIDENKQVETTAELLGVEKQLLVNALCKRTVRAGNRKSMTELSLTAEEAFKSRDGLSKAIYEALFEWLIRKINEATGAAIQAVADTSKRGKKNERKQELFIGILDIFGFEILQDNSFEQLCINYANEALQGMFDEHVLELEMQAYEAESITIKLDYRDNKILLNLLNEKGKGIFQLMDEQGALGNRGSDKGFLKSIENVHGSRQNPRFGRADFETLTFEINHFAGLVEYNVIGMVEKNADHLQPDLADLIAIGGMPEEPKEMTEEEKKQSELEARMKKKKNRTSVVSFGRNRNNVDAENEAPVEDIKETFPFLQSILKLREQGSKAQAEQATEKGSPSRTKRGKKKNRKMARLVSVSSRFRSQMKDLQELLESCDQHFVRCIKPNDRKVPPLASEGWDQNMVSQQMKMLGALEMVRVRRNGFPVRSDFSDVLSRYPEILKLQSIEVNEETDPRKACAALLNAYYEGEKGRLWAMGDTKCFMREQVSKELDEMEQKIHTERLDREARAERRKKEKEKLEKQTKAVVKLQKLGRGYVARKRKENYLKAITILQAVGRKLIVQREYKAKREEARRKRVAATRIQALARGILARNNLKPLGKLSSFQAIIRGMITRAKYKQILDARSRYSALLQPGEAIVLMSLVATDPKASSRTTAGQPHALIMTTGPDPRILFVNDKSGKLKAELIWKYNTISGLMANENTVVLKTEPSGPKMRMKWRFEFMLPMAAKWQLALADIYYVKDLMALSASNDSDIKAHGQVAPLNREIGYYFGGPGALGGLDQVYAQGELEMTQKLEWRRRFFVLKGTSLFWFNDESKFPVGGLTLNPLCTVNIGKKTNSAFGKDRPSTKGIEITSPLLSSPLLLYCNSQKDRVDWMRFISKAIKRRKEKVRRHSVSKGVQNNDPFLVSESNREAFDDRDFDLKLDREEDIEQK